MLNISPFFLFYMKIGQVKWLSVSTPFIVTVRA